MCCPANALNQFPPFAPMLLARTSVLLIRSSWHRVLTTVVAGAALAAAASAPAQPAHLVQGQLLVDQILAAQSQGIHTGDVAGATVFLNRSGGSWDSKTEPSFIRFFDQANGVHAANFTTCAPLVTHLLKHTYGWSWKSHGIIDPLNHGALADKHSPQSYLYVSAIKNLTGFVSRARTLAEVQPGDIAVRWEVGTDDGHTMIVAGVNFATAKAYPQASSDANFLPALAGATYVEMTVLDSSSSGHSNDTRLITYNGTTGLSGGVGEGVMGVFINQAGEIIAHTWSLPASSYPRLVNSAPVVTSGWLSGIKSRVRFQHATELLIGRLPALPAIVP